MRPQSNRRAFTDFELIIVGDADTAYSHNSPDKYRLPIDTPLIPYKFPPQARGW